jgi:hypothetical protein
LYRRYVEAYRARLAAATSAEADRNRLRAAVRAELAQREAGWGNVQVGLLDCMPDLSGLHLG